MNTAWLRTARRIRRRRLLRWGVSGGLAFCVALATYSLVEPRWVRVTRCRIAVPALPPEFEGTTVALLTDIHHGQYLAIGRVRSVVERTNALGADVVALGGDYVYRGPQYIEPSIAELGKLRAKLGVYAVLGNHDHWEGADRTRAALAAAAIRELTNTGVWLTKGSARIRLCGVDDLWEGRQDLTAALGDCGDAEAAILLSHNPDYVEEIRDSRVRLVLSGHTHGGQVNVPLVGPLVLPSRYGSKYAAGLVKTPHTQVFVSRGIGTIRPPVRFNCRPEIVLITLVRGYPNRSGTARP